MSTGNIFGHGTPLYFLSYGQFPSYGQPLGPSCLDKGGSTVWDNEYDLIRGRRVVLWTIPCELIVMHKPTEMTKACGFFIETSMLPNSNRPKYRVSILLVTFVPSLHGGATVHAPWSQCYLNSQRGQPPNKGQTFCVRSIIFKGLATLLFLIYLGVEPNTRESAWWQNFVKDANKVISNTVLVQYQ